MSEPEQTNRAGRARDTSIDQRVLLAAGRHLSELGFEAMSVAAVARSAGTTRQAVYRRWPSKSALAAAVIGQLPPPYPTARPAGAESPFVDPFGELVAELADFAAGMSAPGRLSLVGTMLQDTTDAVVLERYRTEIVAPRGRRLREIVEQAARLELIAAEPDVEIAVTLGPGSWYAHALAGEPAPQEWPARTAALVWRALGGSPPVLPAASGRSRR